MDEKIKILLCEDDENLGMLLREYLQAKGYQATLCPDGEIGYREFLKDKYDICVLDVMMPKKDGFTLAQEIRQANSEIPIIFLTAKTLKEDILEGFKIGADDYITKPFGVKELCARVKAVLRRTEILLSKEDETIVVGDLHIEPKAFEVYQNGEKLALTLKEYELLVFLAKHRGQVLTRDQLLDQIWGFDYYGETRTVDVHIRYLRKKIEEQSEDGKKYIETVRGVGYRFIEK